MNNIIIGNYLLLLEDVIIGNIIGSVCILIGICIIIGNCLSF